MASRKLTIRISTEIQNRLRDLARATGKSKSAIVREAIARYWQQHAAITCYDVAKRAGFIGYGSQGARDLSVNQRHMQGFGRE